MTMELLQKALGPWRHALREGRTPDDEASRKLQACLWRKLEESVAGATSILISPDGAEPPLNVAAS